MTGCQEQHGQCQQQGTQGAGAQRGQQTAAKQFRKGVSGIAHRA